MVSDNPAVLKCLSDLAHLDYPTPLEFSISCSTCPTRCSGVMSRLPEAGPSYIWCLLGHRLFSQTNTSLFCTLCPHSCAPGKNLPVGHPSPNFSGPSTLNLRVLWRLASGKKKLLLVGISILLILLSPGAGVSHVRPL